MARLQRGDELYDVWLHQVPGDVWPSLLAATGRVDRPEDMQAQHVALQYVFAGEREYCRLISQHLRDGWQRVRDPAREADVDGEPSEPTLESALRSDPSDDSAALVYADWLQQRGHPRGALIAVQHARRANPDDAELAAEEARILEEHADVLLGPLAAHAPDDTGRGLRLTWERGFIHSARVEGFHDRGESEDLVWEVLRHPSARLLRELVLGCHHAGDQDNALMADLIVRAGPHPPLRRLVLADFDDSDLDNIDISRAPLGDVGGLGDAYPDLEEVILKGTGDVELAPLALPRARRFALRTSTLVKPTLATILAAAWPALEDLELWFGTPEYGADCEVDDVAPLLRADRFPKLRVLRLMNAMFTDEICAPLLASPLLPRLEELDFSLGTLSVAGARTLVESKSRLVHLRRIGIFECSLTREAIALMRDAGLPIDETPISKAEAWREPQQKGGRYVSVTE